MGAISYPYSSLKHECLRASEIGIAGAGVVPSVPRVSPSCRLGKQLGLESPSNMLLMLMMMMMMKKCTDSRNTFSDQLSVDIKFLLSHRVTEQLITL